MTDCTEYEVLLSLRLDGELTPEEAARLDAHLSACPSCQALAAELEALHAELGDMAPIPPASLAKNVMEQVRNEAKPIPFPVKSKPKKHWKRYGALAAALVLVITGARFLVFAPCGSSGDMAETAAVATEPAEEEAVPTEECAEASEAAEAPAGEEKQDTDSQTYDYTAGGDSTCSKTESAASVEEPFSGSTAADVPAEEAAPEAMESTADESPAEAAPAEAAPSTASNSADAAVPLSKSQARALLQSELNSRGESWTVTDSRQSADGTAWLFTVRESADGLTHRFSVSVENGQVTELSPSPQA